MPQLCPVASLEGMARDVTVARLWRLGELMRSATAVVELIRSLRGQLPDLLLSQLADHLYELCDRQPGQRTVLHTVISYMLGGRQCRITLDDLCSLGKLMTLEGSQPPAGGPRQMTVESDQPAWERSDQLVVPLRSVLTAFSRLRKLTLTLHCTNQLLAAVGRHCPRLASLQVDVALVDDDGIRALLGLPDSVEESLSMCCHGARLSPAYMSSLREISLESTLVSARGYILLLQSLPNLEVCCISEVHLGEAFDRLYGLEREVPREVWPSYALRRLSCRYPLENRQAEAMARSCRHISNLTLRGRGSERNDRMMLELFSSLSELVCVELIDCHWLAVLTFLDVAGRRLRRLRLVETGRFSAGAVFPPSPLQDEPDEVSRSRLLAVLRLCPALTSLRLLLPGRVVVPVPAAGAALPSLGDLRQLAVDGAADTGSLVQLLCACAPALQELRLLGLSGPLTDELALALTAAGTVANLRVLHAERCLLTGVGVDSLVSECKHLRELGQLPEPEAVALRKRCAQNNWNLTVT